MVNVVIKWNNQKFDVKVDPSQSALVFKTQIFSLTMVAPERQKVMVKGGMLKDDTNLGSLNFKEGQQIMMMGTIGELLKEPAKKMKFVEDMTDDEISKALKLPAGLSNHGNTCYLNATLQCLGAIPELSQAIKKYSILTKITVVKRLKQIFNICFYLELFIRRAQIKRKRDTSNHLHPNP